MTLVERIAIGLMVGIFGFLIGMFAWWLFSTAPGLRFGWSFYLTLSVVLGVVSFIVGLWRPERTIDVLGRIGKTIYSISSEIVSWFRFLR